MNCINIDELDTNGFCVIREGIDKSIIDEFNSKYRDAKNAQKETFLSYLSSREEYLNNDTILNFARTEMLQEYAATRNESYSVHLAEARVGSSNINWHRDFNENLEVDKFLGRVKSGKHYLGMLVCVEDFGPDAGLFEAVPTSHTWKIDSSVINYRNMMENPAKCYSYYEDLIVEWNHSTGLHPFGFSGKTGDVIFWYGATIHRGAQTPAAGAPEQKQRNSLILHFSSIPDFELRNSMTCDEAHRKYIRVPGTTNIFQTIHSSD